MTADSTFEAEMASMASEVLITSYLSPAPEIWPKMVTVKIATIIQKRGPRKIFPERVCGGFLELFFAGAFFTGLDFLNRSSLLIDDYAFSYEYMCFASTPINERLRYFSSKSSP